MTGSVGMRKLFSSAFKCGASLCLFGWFGCATVREPPPPAYWRELGAAYDQALRQAGEGVFPPSAGAAPEVVVYQGVAEIPADSRFADSLRRGYAVADLPRNTIHLPAWRWRQRADGARSPHRMLLHELAHLHLYRVTVFVLPPALAELAGVERLNTAPWWLHEGWAGYVEVADLVENRLVWPSLNRARARDLRRLMRAGRSLDPARLLTLDSMGKLDGGDYAVAWALVHWILHHPEPRRRDRNRQAWIEYLAACRRGFYPPEADPMAAFAAEFLDCRGSLIEDWRERWQRRLTHESRRAFLALFVAPMEEAEWVELWREEMATMLAE